MSGDTLKPKEVQKAFGIRLKDDHEKLKANIAQQVKDPEMMAKILDVVCYFQKFALEDKAIKETFRCNLMGHATVHDKRLKFSTKFGRAVEALTHPMRISQVSDLSKNMFDFLNLKQQVQKIVDKLNSRQGDGEETEDDEESPQRYKTHQDDEKVRCDVLDFLILVYEMLEAMPPAFFGDKLTQEEAQSMKFDIGKAVFSMKVCDFSKGVKDVQRVAFVGGEAVGKSTLINYLTSGGRSGDDFMYVAPGMGTQVPCIISHGPQEKFYKTQGPATFGNVEQQIQQESKLKKGKISSIEAFRATRPFNPPINVELVDVPGIKYEKYLETVLALSVCTTVALCLPKLKDARQQLVDGELKLLREIVEKLPGGFHLLGLVTRTDVPEARFQKREYEALLREFFPTAKKSIVVIYANFPELNADNNGQQAINKFYGALSENMHAKQSDPYSILMEIADRLQNFLGKVSRKLCTEMKGYDDSFERILRALKEKQQSSTQKCTMERVKKQLDSLPLASSFKLEEASYPIFYAGLREFQATEISNEVLISEALLLEATLAQIDWTKKQGKSLHGFSFGQGFDAFCELCQPERENGNQEEWKQAARAEVCDGLCLSTQYQNQKSKTLLDCDGRCLSTCTREDWTSKHSSRIGAFLLSRNFQWVITGYYLLEPYVKNKQILDRYSGQASDAGNHNWAAEWNQGLARDLELLQKTAGGWVQQCQEIDAATGSRDAVFNEIFNCMQSACQEYMTILNRKGLVHWSQPLENLLEVCFVMMKGLFVKKPWSEDLQFTSFALHLRKKKAETLELQKLLTEMQESLSELHKINIGIEQDVRISESGSNSVDLAVFRQCSSVVALLQKAGVHKLPELNAKVADLEKDLDTMAKLREQINSRFFGLAAPNVMIVQKHGVDETATDSTTQQAISELRKRFTVHAPTTPVDASLDDISYADRVLSAVRDRGSSVVVYIRTGGQCSCDPTGLDTKILDQMRQEPHVGTIFVLWETSQRSGDPWESHTKKWEELTGGVKVCLVTLTDADTVTDFSQAVDASLKDSAEEICERMSNKRKQFMSAAKKFETAAENFLQASHGDPYGRDAKWFHKELTENIRQFKNTKVEEASVNLTSTASPFDVEFPDGDFLSSLPDFKTGCVVNSDARSINELECRFFLSSVLLGQTMVKADKIASQLYDDVFTGILDEVGAWFQMDGAHLLEELHTFIRDGQAKDQEEKFKDMIVKEHFTHMFIGCALWNVMPMLNAVVMPTMWDNAKHELTKDRYEAHCTSARQMLETSSRASGSTETTFSGQPSGSSTGSS